jgi:excisionase family DNA binding protein
MPTLISISEVQQILGVSRSTVYRLIALGELGCVHIGRCARVPRTDVEAYVERLLSAA